MPALGTIKTQIVCVECKNNLQIKDWCRHKGKNSFRIPKADQNPPNIAYPQCCRRRSRELMTWPTNRKFDKRKLERKASRDRDEKTEERKGVRGNFHLFVFKGNLIQLWIRNFPQPYGNWNPNLPHRYWQITRRVKP